MTVHRRDGMIRKHMKKRSMEGENARDARWTMCNSLSADSLRALMLRIRYIHVVVCME
jgi:hypothetical protein